MGFDTFGAPTFGGAPSNAVELDLPEQNEALLAALASKDTGVLYESKSFQIGAKVVFENGYQCKMVLYYGNKTDFAFSNVTADVTDDAFRAQIRPAEAFAIKPREQVMHLFLWHCMKPFGTSPSIKLKFTCENKVFQLVLRMPFLITSFVTPEEVKSTEFITHWQGSGHEIMGVRKVGTPLTLDAFRNTVSNVLHMKLIDGVEAGKPQNLCASGKFHTATKGADGQFVSIACYLRIETKEGVPMFRVTLHSGHAAVSNALSEAVNKAFHSTS